MRAIFVMYDSLNRRFLQPYGNDWTHTPNFTRLAQRTATFDNCYVGSMPCMPARRELHTGRYNFLHRSWGPLEPFDDSMPQILKENGVHSHLVSDHYHYWEDGGATYHNRYSTWEAVRGQEGDYWKGQVKKPPVPDVVGLYSLQDEVNRPYMQGEENLPQTRTFNAGLEFLERNHDADNWFLHIETFDPHEPFFVSEKYRQLFADGYTGPRFDWPPYEKVTETDGQVAHVRNEYAALLALCDHSLGRVLDFMDTNDMWKDTMLIVGTDHGFLLGEHMLWAKCAHPFYNEIANTPLFIWDPRCPAAAGTRRKALAQTIDLAPTCLEFFGLPLPADMTGHPLRETIVQDTPVRESALFGMHGGQVCVVDGQYVYMRAPNPDMELYDYTLMPCPMQEYFALEDLRQATLAPPFSFTKGCPVLRVPAPAPGPVRNPDIEKTLLFDWQADPGQLAPIRNEAVERRMAGLLLRHLSENDAPKELYARLGLDGEPR